MDVCKQIEYWRTSSDEDFAAAESLLESGHLRHSLFFAHLAIEKMLKAHIVHKTGDIPPQIHNLVRLARLAGLEAGKERESILRRFDVHQLQGRYPDSQQVPLPVPIARDELIKAMEIHLWLKAQLPM